MSRPLSSVQFENTGRVAIVTGGAQGIGLAICDAFQKSNATVIAADIDSATASKLPNGVQFKQCDTSRKEDCERVVAETIAKFGGLDVLVNNAAIQPPESYKPIGELDDELYAKLLGVNFSGYTYMAKHALRQMKRQSSGVVINIASEQGHRTTRGVPVYGPIKAANILQARQSVSYTHLTLPTIYSV